MVLYLKFVLLRIDGEFVVNPTRSQLALADLDMMIAGSADSIVMVEGEGDEISEEEMVEAIEFAHKAIIIQVQAQKELALLVGKTEKRVYSHEIHDLNLKEKVFAATYDKVYAIAKSKSSKHERSDKFSEVINEFIARFR